jgi:hypothetical protein
VTGSMTQPLLVLIALLGLCLVLARRLREPAR